MTLDEQIEWLKMEQADIERPCSQYQLEVENYILASLEELKRIKTVTDITSEISDEERELFNESFGN